MDAKEMDEMPAYPQSEQVGERGVLVGEEAQFWRAFCDDADAGTFPVALLDDAKHLGAGVLELHYRDRVAGSELLSASAGPARNPFRFSAAGWVPMTFKDHCLLVSPIIAPEVERILLQAVLLSVRRNYVEDDPCSGCYQEPCVCEAAP